MVATVSRRNRRRGNSSGPFRPNLPAVNADDGLDRWIDYCVGRMFVVGYTDGGAPYGHVEWPTYFLLTDRDAGLPHEQDLDPF